MSNSNIGILGSLFMGISTAKILDFLLAYRDFDYSESEIAKNAGISRSQLYRALPILVSAGIVYMTQQEGRKKKYRLDQNSRAIYHLERMVYSLIEKRSVMPNLLEDELVENEDEKVREAPEIRN